MLFYSRITKVHCNCQIQNQNWQISWVGQSTSPDVTLIHRFPRLLLNLSCSSNHSQVKTIFLTQPISWYKCIHCIFISFLQSQLIYILVVILKGLDSYIFSFMSALVNYKTKSQQNMQKPHISTFKIFSLYSRTFGVSWKRGITIKFVKINVRKKFLWQSNWAASKDWAINWLKI